MYYAASTAVPTPLVSSQEKGGGIYIPGQGPYPAPHHMAATNYPTPGAQHVLPGGLTPTGHYTQAPPQAYAMVSTPGGHPAYTPSLYSEYSSMPYAASLPRLPNSSPAAAAYIPVSQYPAGMGYQTATMAGRSGPPPGQYSLSAPLQTGAPLFAAGYTQLPAGMSTPGAARSLPMGPVAPGATYPPGYGYHANAAASSEGPGPQIAYTPAGYRPQFQ